MTAGGGAENRDQTDGQERPMKPLDAPERALRIPFRLAPKPAMKKQRFGHEQHDGKHQPHQNHGMHPPERGVAEAVPKVPNGGHVKPGQSDEKGRAASLPCEAAFGGLEKGKPLFRCFHAPSGGQQDRGYETDAADPKDNAEHMEGARDAQVIHASLAIAGSFPCDIVTIIDRQLNANIVGSIPTIIASPARLLLPRKRETQSQ